MEVIPVLDLLNGIVVRGVAGRRSEYQPLRSNLTTSHLPLEVARSLRVTFGFDLIYIADLDAILHGRVNWDVYRQLASEGFRLLIDAGIHDVKRAIQIRECGAAPIVGLESCCSPQILAEIATHVGSELIFSLDLLHGQPQFATPTGQQSNAGSSPERRDEFLKVAPPASNEWNPDPQQIARQAVEAGIRRMIVLDLADVGTSSGGRTDILFRRLRQEHPSLELIGGGGVRGIEDIHRLGTIGVSSALVASALHDGRLSAAQIDSLPFWTPKESSC